MLTMAADADSSTFTANITERDIFLPKENQGELGNKNEALKRTVQNNLRHTKMDQPEGIEDVLQDATSLSDCSNPKFLKV